MMAAMSRREFAMLAPASVYGRIRYARKYRILTTSRCDDTVGVCTPQHIPSAIPNAHTEERMVTIWTDSQMASMHKMLNPSSIAVVGATPRMQYGGRLLAAALQAGDRLRVYPVNPRYDE